MGVVQSPSPTLAFGVSKVQWPIATYKKGGAHQIKEV
jgi:hypothetical protein